MAVNLEKGRNRCFGQRREVDALLVNCSAFSMTHPREVGYPAVVASVNDSGDTLPSVFVTFGSSRGLERVKHGGHAISQSPVSYSLPTFRSDLNLTPLTELSSYWPRFDI